MAHARGDAERVGRLWGAIEVEEQRAFLGLGTWSLDRAGYGTTLLDSPSLALERGLQRAAR